LAVAYAARAVCAALAPQPERLVPQVFPQDRCLPLAVTLCLTLAVLGFLLFTFTINFALRFGQQTRVVFRMLRKVFSIHAVARQLGIAVKLIILFNNLLRRPANLAIRTRAVKNSVDDAAA